MSRPRTPPSGRAGRVAVEDVPFDGVLGSGSDDVTCCVDAVESHGAAGDGGGGLLDGDGPNVTRTRDGPGYGGARVPRRACTRRKQMGQSPLNAFLLFKSPAGCTERRIYK